MALNCPNRDASGDPCGECENCLRVWNGSADLDVVEIDAASNRGVDDARDLRERAMYAPSREGHHKVYIVDEAHMLTREAWNALLKVLEEPPPGVVFVFATTEPQKIAAAAAPVLSRLQRFDFRRIGPSAIRARLRQVLDAEGISADDDALTVIARHADGGMRDALSVLDQCLSFGEGTVTAARVREVLGVVGDDLYVEALRLVAERRPEGVFPLVDRLADAGADLAEFVGGAGEALRALLMLQLGASPEALTEAMRQALVELRESFQPGDVLRMLRLLGESETALRRSGNPRLVVESLLLRWCMLDRMVDLADVLSRVPRSPRARLLRRVHRLRRPASSVAPPAAAPPAVLGAPPRPGSGRRRGAVARRDRRIVVRDRRGGPRAEPLSRRGAGPRHAHVARASLAHRHAGGAQSAVRGEAAGRSAHRRGCSALGDGAGAASPRDGSAAECRGGAEKADRGEYQGGQAQVTSRRKIRPWIPPRTR